jgi:hypothetical protein
MCFNFLMYYPRNPELVYCVSFPEPTDYGNLLKNLTTSGELKVQVPNQTLTVMDLGGLAAQAYYLNPYNITDNLKNQYQNFYENTRLVQNCGLEVTELNYSINC